MSFVEAVPEVSSKLEEPNAKERKFEFSFHTCMAPNFARRAFAP